VSSYYKNFLSQKLIDTLWMASEDVEGVEGLRIASGLQEDFGHIETAAALKMVVDLYTKVQSHLFTILEQRTIDREFIDTETQKLVLENIKNGDSYLSPDYQTIIGVKDASGRIIVGRQKHIDIRPRKIQIPDFLKGPQVTLFGPPDTVKMSINAMNSLHHQLPNEMPIVSKLVDESGHVPRWGADNEDSKTPIMRNFLSACTNLIGCFEKNLEFDDVKRNKSYRLKEDKLAIPIKRIPGLALPDGNHLWKQNPLPLHLYDFMMHLYHNWDKPEALMFYVPKLENEEEATYLHFMISEAEKQIQSIHPEYTLGSVGLFIVFENPRAIFRIQEMADALEPYFIGGSLGWHDFLASTARLFRHDSNYRIPVKADPNIVINHIKESHLILRKSLDHFGAIAIGGMYGTLYEEGNPKSFEVSMIGYIKDVITQMKRDLDGFWVAHPNFVRIGLALVEGFKRHKENPDDTSLHELVCSLVPNPKEQESLLAFVFGPDVDGLEEDDILYERGVLAADIEVSDVIANDDEQEVRYNIFQAVQYLADWLCGNGCVALPAKMKNNDGEDVFVRIMDDLATTERSRWELWAEVNHGRISMEDFQRWLKEECLFIKENVDTEKKRIQVRWIGEAARWYPIAVQILHQLVTDKDPVEFVPELLLPFSLDIIRNASNPFEKAKELHPRYEISPLNWL
jgi:malate synthase